MATSHIADLVGRVLGGRYRLTRRLGQGAFAQVYVADDVTLRRRVAIKVLNPGLADERSFLRRFTAEAQAVASLRHPHILRIYDWGEDDGDPYLVMELLEGGSLRSYLDQGRRLSPAQTARVGADVAHALDYAQRRGLIHRDVKPANLIFDDEGRIALADFGLARALAGAALTEPTGTVIGTARYAAPEQIDGESLDHRADVYSLALVLVEAATGQVPFAADTSLATLMRRLRQPITVPAGLGSLGEVLEAAGTVAAADRLDAAELARRLEEVGAGLPRPARLVLAGPLVSGEVEDDRHPTEIPGRPELFDAEALEGPPRFRPLAPPPPAPPAAAVGQRSEAPAALRPNAAPAPVPAAVEAAEAVQAAEAVPGAAGPGVVAVPATGGTPPRAARPSFDDDDDDDDDDAAVGPAGAAGQPEGVAPPEAGVDAGSESAPPRSGRVGPLDAAAEVAVAAATAGVRPRPESAERTEATGAPVIGGPATSAPPSGAPATSAPVSSAPASGAPKRRRRRRLVGLAAVVVVAGAAVGGAVVYEQDRPTPTEAVPALNGRTPANATAALTPLHLKLAVTGHRYDATRPAGTIVAQQPTGGRLTEGRTVQVVVSDGPEPVAVPAVAGKTEAAATAALRHAGLSVGPVTKATSMTVPTGSVISASPSSGTLLPGRPVALVVSTGKPTVTIPTLSGDSVTSYAAADSALAALGFKTVEIEQYSNTVPNGEVIVTNPPPGRTATVGSTIQVMVSKGPELVTVPNVTGDSVTGAAQALSAQGLTASGVSGNPIGTVESTSPPEGDEVVIGTSVELITG